MVARSLVVAFAVLDAACSAGVGYRVSAGPVVDTDGEVGAELRLTGLVGAYGTSPTKKKGVGVALPIETTVNTTREVGAGYGIDIVRHGKALGRLGFRGGLLRRRNQTRLEPALVAGVEQRRRRRRGELTLGGELRLSLPATFAEEGVEQTRSVRLSLGFVLGRYHYRNFRLNLGGKH